MNQPFKFLLFRAPSWILRYFTVHPAFSILLKGAETKKTTTARFFVVVFRVPRRKVPVNSMQQGSSRGATCLVVTRGSEDPGVNQSQPFLGGSKLMQMSGNFDGVCLTVVHCLGSYVYIIVSV